MMTPILRTKYSKMDGLIHMKGGFMDNKKCVVMEDHISSSMCS